MGMLKAEWCRYTLDFKAPARTSREVLTTKDTWFVKIWDVDRPEVFGLGECPLFRGLSHEDNPYYEKILDKACATINNIDVKILQGWSSIRFGIETALRDLHNGGVRMIYDTPWSRGDGSITINGLIWMGSADEMLRRIDEKLNAGFSCLKLKIGGIEFDRELALLSHIREAFPASELQLRLDANGAFTPENAPERLQALARFDIHSIEQPIRQGRWVEMARICAESPIAVALDEELIGINEPMRKERLLEVIRPKFIILKPALHGGLTGSYEWIELARKHNVGWWLTSALESNIGLNAIAQFASTFSLDIPQGLGTGALYTNNFASPLTLNADRLSYSPQQPWNLDRLLTCF